jgi:hypothetical protein
LTGFAVRFVTRQMDGKPRPGPSPVSGGTPTILVLGAERFRGDIEAISEDGSLRMLCINWSFLRFLLASFVPEPGRKTLDLLLARGWAQERTSQWPSIPRRWGDSARRTALF